ncbi:SinI family restriction endonuclease [Nitrincola schmidtii]|uniref:SinI family restriction endonuclease n=1 Tax=Nitrincola schmidtii TaxID=1730894 RepID=UPI00145689F5|nr:SinI family restriction endonuclease [Nitrincola schmidtii]
MKLKEALEKLGRENSITLAKRIAIQQNIAWDGGLGVVFNAIVNDFDRAPANIGGKDDDQAAAIKKWILKYQSGKDGRASQRISNPPGTVSDPIIEKIIGARITKLSPNDLKKINYGHRLGMSAENILGLILEEYLAVNLETYGWYCAWGETVKSVDFVHKNGRLLQIKNRSNSENSSSSAIRHGTQIEKWFRIKADRIEYMWDSLNIICGTTSLSEQSFANFVKSTLAKNPNCLAVEKENPWI